MPPISTYRLQLRAPDPASGEGGFGFDDAAAVVPYLAQLGVSHVYCSPVLQAAPGSVHGYDVVDHSRLSDDLGGDQGWRRLTAACREDGLGIVVDVVPNHMAMPVPEQLNPALWSALAGGRETPAARWLDVDWDAENGRIMLPVLGRPLADAVAAGEVTIDADAGVARYFDHEFPLAPGSRRDADTGLGEVSAALDRQHYRLAFWREANRSLNYRRFFDVTTLLGVRVEVPEVFEATHARLLELVAAGDVDGMRIDHPDGLADPGGYLERLAGASGGVWTVAEKILEPGEQLPDDWQCAGTTGYDALGAVTNAFVDRSGLRPLDELWRRIGGAELADWEAVVETGKRLVVTETFEAEVRRLVRTAGATGALPGFADAVREVLVAFPVYRAYPGAWEPLDEAADLATKRRPDLADAIGRVRALAAGGSGSEATEFAVRLAQTTGPVMAKGVEDTALYRYHRLIALNEVGGDPGVFGRPLSDFHAFCARTVADWPATMTTLSTHDTKRSEDVRARLLVLSEIPGEWAEAVGEWERLATRDGWPDLDAATRYLTWQTLVGAWPLPADRLSAYLEKATREAKLHTSWTDRDETYDTAVEEFAQRAVRDAELSEAVAGFVRGYLLEPGRSNALSQKLVQLTMPGVPDVYQGNELTDLSLVDPDNRRPVDYGSRVARLRELGPGSTRPEMATDDMGALKLAVVTTALHVRRERPEGFLKGGYEPLEAVGPAAAHLLGFTRGSDIITLATRLPVGLRRRGGWADTRVPLPAGPWRDILAGRPVESDRLDRILDRLPVALLVRADG